MPAKKDMLKKQDKTVEEEMEQINPEFSKLLV